MLMKARQSNVKQSRAKQSKVKQSKAMQSSAKLCKAKQSKAKQRKAKQSKAKQSQAKQGIGMHTFCCSGKFKLRYMMTGTDFAQVVIYSLSTHVSCNQRSRMCMFKITDRMCIFNILLHTENSPAAAISFMHAVDDCI